MKIIIKKNMLEYKVIDDDDSECYSTSVMVVHCDELKCMMYSKGCNNLTIKC